ncbi:MAG: hypothetical protein AAGJ38_00740 [Planctomycetota bacterium]
MCKKALSALFILGAATAQAQFTTVLNVPGDDISGLGGIGSSTQLNLASGGTIPSSLIDPFDAGLFQDDDPGAPASSNVEVNVTGGSVGPFLFANAGSTINISGGSVGDLFSANNGSMINVSGGSIGASFLANAGSQVNISGGTLGEGFVAGTNANVNLLGSFFALDGTDITGTLSTESSTALSTRGGAILTGTLSDGSAFSFTLNDTFSDGDFFALDSVLTLMLQASFIEGDYNGNGLVDQADLNFVLANWGASTVPPEFIEAALPGGGPFDGAVDQNELNGVLGNWGSSVNTQLSLNAIPEPAAAAALLLLGLGNYRRRSM